MSSNALASEADHAAVHGSWQLRLESDATVTWTSLTGQTITQESDLRYLVEPEDLTDSELAALTLTHPDHPSWIRPWWEILCLDHPPGAPPPGPPGDSPLLIGPTSLSDDFPFRREGTAATGTTP